MILKILHPNLVILSLLMNNCFYHVIYAEGTSWGRNHARNTSGNGMIAPMR